MDSFNGRTLRWDSFDSFMNQEDPSTLLGQASYTSNEVIIPVSGSTLLRPVAIAMVDGKYFIADRDRNRVLVWNSFPSNGSSANFALGQPNLGAWSHGRTATNFHRPTALCSYQSKLVLSDRRNKRLLIYNSPPANGTISPDIILGASNMTDLPFGSPGSSSFEDALGVNCNSDGKLVVSDRVYNRVLIWNSFPTTDNQPADVVLGQPDFVSSGLRDGAPSASKFMGPNCAKILNRKLYVCDSEANRILYWNEVPTANDTPADGVIGQNDFNSFVSGYGPGQFQAPSNIEFHNGILFVTDNRNNRIVGVKVPE
jgi:hypothetical protein